MLITLSAALLIFLDQLSKFAANRWLAPVDSAQFIPGIINLFYTENTGASFSMLEGFRWGFVVLTVVVAAVLLRILFHPRHPAIGATRAAIVMILAGAVGNGIDRALCGRVVDMFQFDFINFPVFNVADIYINIGIAWLVLLVVLGKSTGLGFDKTKAADYRNPL